MPSVTTNAKQNGADYGNWVELLRRNTKDQCASLGGQNQKAQNDERTRKDIKDEKKLLHKCIRCKRRMEKCWSGPQ